MITETSTLSLCFAGEKPFACDYQDCDRRFAELSTLKKHKITHTGKQIKDLKLV